jgi:gluconate kinase
MKPRVIQSADFHEASLMPDGTFEMGLHNIKYKPMNYKIAMSGSSGSGKTTLVEFVAQHLGIKHISGSAGDVKQEGDKMMLDEMFGYPGGGHVGVIRYSALNPEYGLTNQKLLQMRRAEILHNNDNFITDRSPADNMTYMINQVAYHPMVTDAICEEFFKDCLRAWEQLTHVVYVKAVQPKEVERNGSRVANRWYQKAIDAQFEYWINRLQAACLEGPEVFIIDFWDLEERKSRVLDFLKVL